MKTSSATLLAFLPLTYAEGGPIANALYGNDNTPSIPTLYAMESLTLLSENMVASSLLWTDLEEAKVLARYGDTVNFTIPRVMPARRKVDGETVKYNPAVLDRVPVVLDQHWYNSFTLFDGELNMSITKLVDTHLRPCIEGIARGVDRAALAQLTKFAFNNTKSALIGKLGVTPDKKEFLKAMESLNLSYAPDRQRYALLSTRTETEVMGLDSFSRWDAAGPEGPAVLRNAILGRKFSFDFMRAPNLPDAADAGATVTSTTDAAILVGATTITLAAGDGANHAAGEFVVVEGEGTPLRIVSKAVDVLTVDRPMRSAVATGAVVVGVTAKTINQTSVAISSGGTGTVSGYRKGWHGVIAIDEALPAVGQLVSFGTTAITDQPVYVVIESIAGEGFMLDRLLETAIADGSQVNFGPVGSFNFCFHRHAVGLITRTMEAPRSGLGVDSATADHNGLALRVTQSYDQDLMKHKFTIDMIAGFKDMYEGLGAVVLG